MTSPSDPLDALLLAEQRMRSYTEHAPLVPEKVEQDDDNVCHTRVGDISAVTGVFNVSLGHVAQVHTDVLERTIFAALAQGAKDEMAKAHEQAHQFYKGTQWTREQLDGMNQGAHWQPDGKGGIYVAGDTIGTENVEWVSTRLLPALTAIFAIAAGGTLAMGLFRLFGVF